MTTTRIVPSENFEIFRTSSIFEWMDEKLQKFTSLYNWISDFNIWKLLFGISITFCILNEYAIQEKGRGFLLKVISIFKESPELSRNAIKAHWAGLNCASFKSIYSLWILIERKRERESSTKYRKEWKVATILMIPSVCEHESRAKTN